MAGPKKAPELQKELILNKALDIADREGMHALTIRGLARELNAGAMSIYYYFASKEEIIDAMTDCVYGEITLPPVDLGWKEAIARRCHSVREVLGRHPWASSYMDSRRHPGPLTLSHSDAFVGCFLNGGFSLEAASKAIAITDAYVFGFALQEATLPGGGGEEMIEMSHELQKTMARNYPYLTKMARYVTESAYSFAAIFDAGLELLLDGLEREL